MITCHRKHLEQRCRERGCKLADVMPCVVKQDGDTWTIDTDHPAYPSAAKPASPDTPEVSPAVLSLRKAACLACKHLAHVKDSPVVYCRIHCPSRKGGGKCESKGIAKYQKALLDPKPWCEPWQTPEAVQPPDTPETRQHADEFARSLEEVAKAEPQVFVEIGVHAGGSLRRYVDVCAPGAVVIGVDIGEREETASIPGVIGQLREKGFDAHWIKGDSRTPETIQRAKDILAGRSIDLLHIDGSHKEADVLADWRNWTPMMSPGGMVVFHDVASRSNGAPAAWRKCREGLPYLEIVTSGAERYRNGTGIVWLKATPKDFGRVSVIMPARQEGEQVRLTCESFLAAGVDEIIIIDDGSTDGSCKNLPHGVTVLRNEKPVGVGRARNQGVAASTGDVLIFADAHERAPASLRPFAQAAVDHHAIVCAAVKPLRDTGSHGPGRKRSWTGYGGKCVMDENGASYKAAWQMNRPKTRFTPLTAVIGACYAMTRETFDRIGGWVETRQWGYNEQGLALKAWYCNVPMILDRDTVVYHQFKKKFKYPSSLSGAQVNRWHIHAVVFEPETFETVWAPAFRKAFGSTVEKQARALLATPEVQAEIVDFKNRRVRTDAQFFEWAPKPKGAPKAAPKAAPIVASNNTPGATRGLRPRKNRK